MRSDIINEVLSVEDRAQKIVRDAERTARDAISDAQTKANAYIRSALKAEREQSHAQILQAEADAEAELQEFEASLHISSSLTEAELDRISQTIVEKVCATDLDSFVDAQ
ncbi:hypothetical protein SDC9_160791 [bioreactor metagenome]|uniref:Uncharacterized protein n=1 Tax=bioreactor metagenome TaxID=1076179 RepID=A0A645FHN3_9ZZZZ|nr:hypothetical protein [Sphaerochaeta sp.]